MIVSTLSTKSSTPCSAIDRLCAPSKLNGLVTTAIVKAPASRASSATNGPAPVPVPPPKPQVKKTMSAPFNTSLISSRDSSADFLPKSGSMPAPKPRVVAAPICNFTEALECCRAWASVFMATNSTPRNLLEIMRLIAAPPEPPTPTTLILANVSISGLTSIW
ncbi:MAG: hypothetical protein UV69_C0037G0004 [Parcubacteria group bacterium GW2011_GWE2_43_12]|nr:MAG: hypothetical protein UV69_C0037G0004 [Parcubacteria group bacterium GW2011_GWE2_43_12]